MLWDRYHRRLVALAGRKLLPGAKAVTDEDDIAVEAFHSFIRRCRQGSYPDLHDRHDLWRLLMAITIHKANNQIRDQQRLRRDFRRSNGDSIDVASDDYGLEQLTSKDPPAELVAILSDSLERLFSLIPDGELRQMVLYKLEGYTNAEIATKLKRSRPTIERRLRLIREIWREEFDE